MSLLEITNRIAGFLKFAGSSSPSKIVRSCLDPLQEKIIASVYQRCVPCHEQRFTKKQLNDLSQVKWGTNLHFDHPREERTWVIKDTAHAVVEHIWNRYIPKSNV
jgi:hypothetical protein